MRVLSLPCMCIAGRRRRREGRGRWEGDGRWWRGRWEGGEEDLSFYHVTSCGMAAGMAWQWHAVLLLHEKQPENLPPYVFDMC